MTEISYDVACARYASDQGLDPIGTILTLSGIPWNLEQTGGWCMVVNVNFDDPRYYLWLTSDEQDDVIMLGVYDGITGYQVGDSEDAPDGGYLYIPLNQLADTVNEMRHR